MTNYKKMNYDTNFDDMEAYILDNMSETEKIQFELRIEQDPILKTELDIQTDTIETVREIRKEELKARFDEIVIVNNNPLILKGVLATLGISVTLAVSLLLFQSNSNSEKSISENKNNTTKETNLKEDSKIENKVNILKLESKIEQTATQESNNREEDSDIRLENTLVYTTPTSLPNKVNPIPPLPETNDIIETEISEEERAYLSARMLRIPPKEPKQVLDVDDEFMYNNPKMVETPVFKPKIDNFTPKKKNNLDEFNDDPELSYQFYNNNIFLYPKNSDKAPVYEQISLYNQENKEIEYYIYYKETYYRIKENQKKTDIAEKTTDVKKIKRLNELKEQKLKERATLINN